MTIVQIPAPAAAAAPGTLLDCPDCGAPAVVTDRFTLDGVPAPVPHVRVECLAGHWFTEPVDRLWAAPEPVDRLWAAPEPVDRLWAVTP